MLVLVLVVLVLVAVMFVEVMLVVLVLVGCTGCPLQQEHLARSLVGLPCSWLKKAGEVLQSIPLTTSYILL